MPEAARLGDPIGHTRSMGWMIAGLIAGAVIGAALAIATGGAALVVIAGAVAGAAACGGIGEVLATMSWAPLDITGSLVKGSENVFVNGKAAIYAHLSLGACSKHSGSPKLVAEGSKIVFINGWPAARKGDHLECDAKIAEGSNNVTIGGPTAQTDPIEPEVPAWVNWTLMVAGFAAAVVLAGPIIAVVGTLGALGGGWAGGAIGRHFGGEGSDAEKWGMLAGSFIGGALGAKGGGMFAKAVIPEPATGVQAFARGGLPAMDEFVPPKLTAADEPSLAKAPMEETSATEAVGREPAKIKNCSDPVDVAAGAFIDWRTDIVIPGALPIEWRRRYSSAFARETSFFGSRWRDSWSVCLSRDAVHAAAIDYHDGDGVVFTFDTPEEELNVGHLRSPGMVLRGTRAQPVLWQQGRRLAAHFEWQGNRARLAAYSDASGNRCNFIYEDDAKGVSRLMALKHSDGWQLRLHWMRGCVSSVWLHEPDRPPVELVRYRQDDHGRLVHSATLEGGRLYYRYDQDDRMVGWGDDSATHVTIAYNAHGRVACVDTPNSLHSARFEYNLDLCKTFVWKAGSNDPLDPNTCTVYTYNADLLVTCERDPLGNETHTEWDANHRVIAFKDALGRITRNQYDATGRLTASVDARERKDEFQYDDEGRLLAATDPYGRRISRAYDECGRLVSETAPDGIEAGYDYDARGRLQAVHLPAGSVCYHYDEQHRPCGRTLPNGAEESWRQNRLGQLDWHTDALGATTTFEHDIAGDPDSPAAEPPRAGAHFKPHRIVRADGSGVERRYTQEGLLSEAIDADGRTQQWQWGAFDLLTQHIDATGRSTRYRYGADGRLTELVNAAGQSWHWLYDGAGRVSEEIDYAGRRTRWERDALGRPLVRRQPDATPWRYEWDERDRLRALRAPDVRHEYAYDDHDQLIEASVWRGDRLDSRLDIEYDELGRVVAETHRCGRESESRRIAFRYDDQGRLIGRDGPLGETRYAFDALGLLRELHTAHGALHIARDAQGRQTERASRPLSPGLPAPEHSIGSSHFHLRQQHDKLGRLIHQQAGEAAERSFHWHHDQLVGIDDARFGSVRWQLDARGQIVEAAFGGPHGFGDDRAHLADGLRSADERVHERREQFAYDAVGNVAGINGSPVRYEGDVVVEGGHNRYVWDANGRMVRRTEQRNGFRPRTWHYDWDSFNRLLAVTTPEGQRWRYVYDAFGRRRAKRCESPQPSGKRRPALRQAEYLWDGPTLAAHWKTYADGTSEAPEQIQEWHYDAGGFTPLAVVQQRDGKAQMLHVVADLNGAPRELLDNDGELVWAGQFDTWGNLARCHVQDADKAFRQQFFPGYRPAANDPVIDVELRFANQWADEESGLYYNLNRYYDPAVGQYASQDPLGPAGGLRTHGYVPNPTLWMDPCGLTGCPTTDPVEVRGSRSIDRGHSYEAGVRELYGDMSFQQRQYTAIVNGNRVNGVADSVTSVGGRDTAVEAKYVDNWDATLRNPDSPVGARPWAVDEQQTMVDQAAKYSAGFDGGVIYHTNSSEFAAHYTQVFNNAGITNFKFVITPATRL